jgi:hypothetical protein
MSRQYDDGFPFELRRSADDYSSFGPSFFVDVPVTSVECQVVWINESWFAGQGVDLHVPEVAKAVERWLIKTFSVEVPKSRASISRKMRADRYGAAGGTVHGGSGRCAYLGRFNGKGIGPTSLVPAGLQGHSDGALLLTDAIREAVYAELCHFETIHGAVRTIAILAKPPFEGCPTKRNCIAVRPNFIRPAHFERSLIFGSAGSKESDQFKDAVRVEQVRRWAKGAGIDPLSIVSRNAAQIGAMDAMRMVQGRFTSANVSIGGRVADFGSFRFMDNWRYARLVTSDSDVFGKDLQWLERAATKWIRATDGRPVRSTEISHLVDTYHREGFFGIVRRALNLPSTSLDAERETINLFYETFLRNRGSRVDGFDRWPFPQGGDRDQQVSLHRVSELLKGHRVDSCTATAAIGRVALWTLPRTELSYSGMNRTIDNLVVGTGPYSLREKVSAFIGRLVVKNRRVFGRYPSTYIPLGHCSADGRQVVYCLDSYGKDYKVVVWERGSEAINSNEYQVFECPPNAIELGCHLGAATGFSVPKADITYNRLQNSNGELPV